MQRNLAATLRRVSDQGRDGFYAGATAHGLATLAHGLISNADLTSYPIVPKPEPSGPTDPASPSDLSPCGPPPECVAGSRYQPWAALLKCTFSVHVETCPDCGGRMRLLAVITDLASAARFLRHRGEPTEPQPRSRSRPTLLEEPGRTTTRPIRALSTAGVVRRALN